MSLVRKCDLCKATVERGFFGIELIKFTGPPNYDYIVLCIILGLICGIIADR